MKKRAFLYGGLAALGVAVWTLLEFALGLHGARAEVGRYTGFLALVFPIGGIILALRAARRAGAGRLGFRQGLAQGAAVTGVLSVLGAAFIWVYFAVINPGFREGGRTLDPAGQAITVLSGSLMAGLIISALASLALRRRVEDPQS